MRCGGCHAVTNPKGARIEETFPEWAASSFAERDETCQDCHMPAYEGRAASRTARGSTPP
jgi:nitrate/TMAO reductase-like tetraheme cytochrome c subunit